MWQVRCTHSWFCVPLNCSSPVCHLDCIPWLHAVATSSLQLRTAEDTVLQVLEQTQPQLNHDTFKAPSLMFSPIKPQRILISNFRCLRKLCGVSLLCDSQMPTRGWPRVRFQSEDSWCTEMVLNQDWTQTGLKQSVHGPAVQVKDRLDLLLPNSFSLVASATRTSLQSFMRAKDPAA